MTGWMARASCAGADPEMFFPTPAGSAEPARLICAGCPVNTQCGDYAATFGPELNGVWAGLTRTDRGGRPRRPNRACRNCGTVGLDRRRQLCEPCRTRPRHRAATTGDNT